MFARINVRYGNLSGAPGNAVPTPSYSGHAWITIHSDDGVMIDNMGFVPTSNGAFYGGQPGALDVDNGPVDWISPSIPITTEQYQGLID